MKCEALPTHLFFCGDDELHFIETKKIIMNEIEGIGNETISESAEK